MEKDNALVDAFMRLSTKRLQTLRYHLRIGHKVYCGAGSARDYVSKAGYG